jgi:hypothetical protein
MRDRSGRFTSTVHVLAPDRRAASGDLNVLAPDRSGE